MKHYSIHLSRLLFFGGVHFTPRLSLCDAESLDEVFLTGKSETAREFLNARRFEFEIAFHAT